jgi:hypothetical protein
MIVVVLAALLCLEGQPPRSTRQGMPPSSRARLPAYWPPLARQIPEGVRLEIETALTETLEQKDNLRESEKEWFEKVLKAKDGELERDRQLLEEKEQRIIDGHVKYLQAVNQFHVVYELRDTFDWLLRCVYPDDSSKPGAMYIKLMDEIADKNTGRLEAVFEDKYNELSLHFKVGRYQPSSLMTLRGCHKELNNNMHGSDTFDVLGRTGISCGGKSRHQQHTHAFFVVTTQLLCEKKGIVLPSALQKINVLNNC